MRIEFFSTTFSNYFIPGIRESNGTPLQYSCLENPMNRGAWWATVHGVAKSRTQLRDFPFTFHFHASKEMATHSSTLAWRILGTGEAWWAAVYGVAQSWIQLKRLSSSSMRAINFCTLSLLSIILLNYLTSSDILLIFLDYLCR